MQENEFIRIGRPGALGSRKNDVLKNYDLVYGKDNWRLVFDVNGQSLGTDGAVLLYEDAYMEHFKRHPEELRWITDTFADVYDNNPSNVHSGLDYAKQEFGGNHYQDIAVRRCAVRAGLGFQGQGLLEIRMKGVGKRWGPGNLPFHRPELIPKPEIPGWWMPGSIESWYQSAKHLEAKADCRPQADVIFVTGNPGKVYSARKSLEGAATVGHVALDIAEDLPTVDEVAVHKAKVGYSVLCKPVIADDSALVIPSLGGYPGPRVKRELASLGLGYFLELARAGPRPAKFQMALAYLDGQLARPAVFMSEVAGMLIGEQRGSTDKPNVKSPLFTCFVPDGQPGGARKTLAEMTQEEYDGSARTDRWLRLRDYLRERGVGKG